MNDPGFLLDDPAAGLTHSDPHIRRLAVSCLATDPRRHEMVAPLLGDESAAVRAEAAVVLGTTGEAALEPLLTAAANEAEDAVIEAMAFALGEIGETPAIAWLLGIATGDGATAARETAVASLGAIGDPSVVPTLLDLVTTGPPHVRKRCVVALTVFEGAAARAAIEKARTDRNSMVREAAEMVVGRPID
ncbi:MAG: HEAT repeat domain-containing protein [Acidimicrobiia bacterium]